eukprot:403353057
MSFFNPNSISQVDSENQLIEILNNKAHQNQMIEKLFFKQSEDFSAYQINNDSQETVQSSKDLSEQIPTNLQSNLTNKENVFIQPVSSNVVEVKKTDNKKSLLKKSKSPIKRIDMVYPKQTKKINEKSVSRKSINERSVSRSTSQIKIRNIQKQSKSPQKILTDRAELKESQSEIINLKKITTNGQYTFSNTLTQEETQNKLLEPVGQLSSISSYTSRNQNQSNQRIQQQSQSTLCNVGSVKNKDNTQQIILNFNQPLATLESFDHSNHNNQTLQTCQQIQHINQVSELKDQVQILQAKVSQMKEKSKKEKLQTVNQLKIIEDNYQKYAYYYTKYLEEKIVYNELQNRMEEYQEVIQGQQGQLQIYKSIANSLVDILYQDMQQSFIRKTEVISAIKSQLQNNQMQVEPNEDAQILQKLQFLEELLIKQTHESPDQLNSQMAKIEVQQAYQSGFHSKRSLSQQFNNSRSDHKRKVTKSGGRSSTPKTQMRYQECKEEDEDDQYHYQHFPSAIDFSDDSGLTTKRDQAIKIFRQSIQSPPVQEQSEDRISQETLRVKSNNYGIILQDQASMKQSLSRQSLLSQLPLSQQSATQIKKNDATNQELNAQSQNNIYEYTLKNCNLQEEVKPQANQLNNLSNQSNNNNLSNKEGIISFDLYQKRQSLQNPGQIPKSQSNGNALSAFSDEVMNSISKLDTFSHSLIQDQPSNYNQNIIKIDDGQDSKPLKYSVEFVNGDDSDQEDQYCDSQSSYDLVQTSEKTHPKKLGFSSGSINMASFQNDENLINMMASTNDLEKFKIGTQQLQEFQKLSQNISNQSQRQSQQRLMQEQQNNHPVSSRSIEIAVAIQQFVGEKEQDLSFKIGEKILIEQKIKGSIWMYGSIGARKGWFPQTHVKIEEHFL